MALQVPEFIQATSGSPTYSAQRARMMTASLSPMQQGVGVPTPLWPNPLRVTKTVTEQGEIAPRSVYVQPGEAFIKSSQTRGGYYHIVNDAKFELPIPMTGTSPNQSMDIVVARIEDSTDLGSSGNRAYFDVIPGVASGAISFNTAPSTVLPALPTNCIPLAYIDNENTIGGVGSGNIMDARAWAHGFFAMSDYTFDKSISLSTYAAVGNLPRRFMCNSGLVRVRFTGYGSYSGAAVFNASWRVQWAEAQGNAIDTSSLVSAEWVDTNEIAATRDHFMDMEWYLDVTPGVCYKFNVYGKVTGTSAVSIKGAAATDTPMITYEEIVRPNAWNGTGGV